MAGQFKRRGRGRRGAQRKRYEEEKPPWVPKTDLGKDVMAGKFKSLEEILEKGLVILEPEIVDFLVSDLGQEIIYVGGSPGKGGGIRRTATKRTCRMHKSGRRFKLTAYVVVGDGKGLIGIGKASSREHRVALDKAITQAKLTMIRVRKGCGSWECGCGGEHSIPFKVSGKQGSVRVELMPAPKGVGMVGNDEAKKLLRLSGVKDVWMRTTGSSKTRGNLAYSVFKAFKELNRTKGDL